MSEKYDDIKNEIIDNDYFENSDLNYKIIFMSKAIDIIINETINDIDKLIIINKNCQVGFCNKAISEMALNDKYDVLSSAKSAKKYLIEIDINNEKSINFCMYKYNEKIIHINKSNIIIKNVLSQLLDNDKVISDDDEYNSD
jgi:hypothetical protein